MLDKTKKNSDHVDPLRRYKTCTSEFYRLSAILHKPLRIWTFSLMYIICRVRELKRAPPAVDRTVSKLLSARGRARGTTPASAAGGRAIRTPRSRYDEMH
jgi:hypothetical protein